MNLASEYVSSRGLYLAQLDTNQLIEIESESELGEEQ